MFKIATQFALGVVVAHLALWAGLTAYNFVATLQDFGGVFANLWPMITHPAATLEIVQMSFYNALGDVGYTYHDFGMTGPFVLLYALVITAYTLFKTQQAQ
jgi:hypothetical protein